MGELGADHAGGPGTAGNAFRDSGVRNRLVVPSFLDLDEAGKTPNQRAKPFAGKDVKLERAIGIEPTTFSLGS
jgi:hypothetical protein